MCFLSYSKLFIYLVSSVHPRHGGGDARKAHLEQSQYSESLEILCLSVDTLHYSSCQLSIHHCYLFHPPSPLQMDMIRSIISLTSYFHHCYLFHPPMPLWMDLPKRHTLAGQNIVSLEIVRVSQYPFSTRLTTSSIHPRHGGGDAREAHLEQSQYCEILEILCLRLILSIISLTSYQQVIFITATCSIHHRHCRWI